MSSARHAIHGTVTSLDDAWGTMYGIRSSNSRLRESDKFIRLETILMTNYNIINLIYK
jgi:hypothetical protein